jgi:hypothetical protein
MFLEARTHPGPRAQPLPNADEDPPASLFEEITSRVLFGAPLPTSLRDALARICEMTRPAQLLRAARYAGVPPAISVHRYGDDWFHQPEGRQKHLHEPRVQPAFDLEPLSAAPYDLARAFEERSVEGCPALRATALLVLAALPEVAAILRLRRPPGRPPPRAVAVLPSIPLYYGRRCARKKKIVVVEEVGTIAKWAAQSLGFYVAFGAPGACAAPSMHNWSPGR